MYATQIYLSVWGLGSRVSSERGVVSFTQPRLLCREAVLFSPTGGECGVSLRNGLAMILVYNLSVVLSLLSWGDEVCLLGPLWCQKYYSPLWFGTCIINFLFHVVFCTSAVYHT